MVVKALLAVSAAEHLESNNDEKESSRCDSDPSRLLWLYLDELSKLSLDPHEPELMSESLELISYTIAFLHLMCKVNLLKSFEVDPGIATVKDLVGWSGSNDSHPLQVILHRLRHEREIFPVAETKQPCEDLSSLMDRFSCTGDAFYFSKNTFPEATPLEDRFDSLNDLTSFPTLAFNSSLYSREYFIPVSFPLFLPDETTTSFEHRGFYVPDFFDDYVVPDPRFLKPLTQTKDHCLGQKQSPPQKHSTHSKRKFDKFTKMRTYTREGFRSRKNGTGRKPSVHVDDFMKNQGKKAEEKMNVSQAGGCGMSSGSTGGVATHPSFNDRSRAAPWDHMDGPYRPSSPGFGPSPDGHIGRKRGRNPNHPGAGPPQEGGRRDNWGDSFAAGQGKRRRFGGGSGQVVGFPQSMGDYGGRGGWAGGREYNEGQRW